MTFSRVASSISLFFVLMGTQSCMLAAKDRFFEYERLTYQTSLGEFSVRLSPEPKLVQEGGKEFEVFGAPYHFNTQYSVKEGTVLNGEITNIEIQSLDTDEIIFRKQLIIDIYRSSSNLSHHAMKQKRGIGFGGGLLNIPYHDYKISFDFKLYKEEGIVFEQGRVEVVLKRDYYEAHVRKGAGIL